MPSFVALLKISGKVEGGAQRLQANQYIDKYLRDSDPLTIIDTVIGESIRPLAEPSTYSAIKKPSLAG